jgi:hypothetical protein
MVDLVPIALSSIAIIISIIVSVYAYNISKRQLHHPALEYLRRDYRSPEMMLAIQNLWSFKRLCESKAVKLGRSLDEMIAIEYIRIAKDYNAKIDAQNNYDKKLSFIQNSLSYQRRLVISFYYYLFEVWEYEILTPEMIFEYWDRSNMDIFDILKPIEMTQAIIYVDRDDKKEEYIKATEKWMTKLDKMREASKNNLRYKDLF